ncbi:MAG: GspE/PulE family protein [Myxococcota bacterium]
MGRKRIEQFKEFSDFSIHAPSIRMLPERLCRKAHIVILNNAKENDQDDIYLGMHNIENGELISRLTLILNRQIHPILLNKFEIHRALDIGHGHAKETEGSDASVEIEDIDVDINNPDSLLQDIIAQAVKLSASDIHIETYRNTIDIRLRIDGVMHQIFSEISPQNISGVINRLKILAKLDIAERRVPQDGRFKILVESGDSKVAVDFRLNICPGPYGEDAVIRVLGSHTGMMAFSQLGMSDIEQTALFRILNNPEGMFFVTGPTGSGKTTTLYAALSTLNDGTRKIVTAEDPIEFDLPKITQKQVSPLLTYPLLARSFLRMDPDVMLIGEVRDHETADAITRAASTGHLALSTLHTTDSFSTVVRLRSLGLDNSLIANTLLGALAQRLLRRICTECKTEVQPTETERALFKGLLPHKIYTGKGCVHCHDTGYKGRIGVYEIFMVDHHIQDMLLDNAPTSQIRNHAHHQGYHSLLHDALSKVADGITSLEEVIRTLPYRYILELTEE